MADLTAKFRLIDEMSDKLSSMAESGQQMVDQFERAGATANSAFDGISRSTVTTAGTIDGVAMSVDSLQGAANNAASSADSLTQTLNGYGDAAGAAAENTDYWTDAVGNYDKGALEAVYTTEELVEMGMKSSEALAAQEAAMQQCEQAASELSQSVEKAGETEKDLSEAMEKASQISEEIAKNDNVSAEAKEELAKASQKAEEAFDELAAAQQKAEQAMEDYDRVMASGTDNLEELQRAAERTSQATEELDNANGKAAAATEELSAATQQAADEAESSSDRSKKAFDELSNIITAAGITQTVKEMAEAFFEASEAAAEFETATMKISTVADTTKVSLSQISSDVMKLSKETGIGVDNLSEATYSALSASVDTADAVEFTATASKLAAGGFTSSATAVDVLTTALNAYGLEANHAENISDMLITTQNLGKTTVDELAASVGKVIPLASAYGVEMDNLSAAYAELTKGGIATAEAGTYLKSILSELGDSGSAVSEVLKEQTGSSFAELMEQGYSLGDVMAVLGDSVGGNAGAFNELWSSSEAGIGALSLFNAGAEQFNTTLDAMQSSVGATEQAYKTMTDTTAHAQEEMSNAADNLQIAIGQNINPLVEKLYGMGTNVLNFMSDFASEHPVFTKAISAIGIGIGVTATTLTGFIFVTKVAIPAITTFGVTLNTALGPIGWVAMAITGLVAAGAALIAMFEEDMGATEGMTAATRAQYYELEALNSEYEEACAKYGENSEEASRLKYQLDDLSAAFEMNRQTVEEFTAEVDALCESVTEISDNFENAMTEINAQETGMLALIQKYEDLASQSELTGAQQKELEAVTKKLTETYPELADQLDNATLSAEDYVDAMKKACEQQAEQQRQEQAQQTYIEALQKRAELTEEIAKAQENVNLEQERMDDMSGWTHFWTGGEWDDLEAYETALEELNAAMAENDAVISEIEQGWEDISAAEEAAANETMTWQEAAASAYEGVREKVEELCVAYDEAYAAALESFQGQFGLFDEASTSSEEYMNATVSNAQAAMDSQLAYWDSYLANVQTLKSVSAEDLGITQENYEALMAYAQSGNEEAAGLAASMVEAINSGNAEAVAALANTVGEVQAKQEEASAAVADWQTNFTASLGEIETEMATAIEGMNLSEEAQASAQATISAYIEQISSSTGEAAAAAESVVQAIQTALTAAENEAKVEVDVEYKPNTEYLESLTLPPKEAEAEYKLDSSEVDNYTMPDQEAEAEYILNSSLVDAYQPDDKDAEAKYSVNSWAVDNWTPPNKTATLTYNITTAGSVPGHANGTTNAENVFVAGEEGPELIVSKAAAYANGTTDSDEFYIAGENGPELIIGQQGSTVFPTGETDRLIDALSERQPLKIMAEGLRSEGREKTSEQVKRILLEIAGSGAIEIAGGRGGADKETILEVLYEHLKPVLMSILQSEIYEEGELSYEF